MTRQNSRLVFRPIHPSLLLIVAFSLLFFASPVWSGDPPPVVVEEVPIKIGTDVLALRFCPCPAGNVLPGEPGKKQLKAVSVGPFFLSEAEVSQDVYRIVMGQEAFDKVKKRATLQFFEKEFSDKDFPIITLTFAEAARFCVRLEELYRDNETGSGVFERRFRIPTNLEWQYACRGPVDPEREHFNRWATLKDLEQETKDECKQLWEGVQKKRGIKEEFIGSQRQVIVILEEFENEGLPVLSAFLLKANALKTPISEKAGKLSKVKSTSPNEWGLFDMHGNAYEWTIEVKEHHPILISSVWLDIAKPKIVGPSKDSFRPYLCGGAFHKVGTNKLWKKFTHWEGDAFDYQQANAEKEIALYAGGIRILMEAQFSFQKMREFAVSKNRTLPELEKEFDTARRLAERTMSSDGAKLVKVQTHFYAALRHSKLGNTKEAAAEIQKAGDLGSDALEVQRYLIGLDQKRRP